MYRIIPLIFFCIQVFATSASAQSVYDINNMQQAREAYQKGDYNSAVTYMEQTLDIDSLQLDAHILLGSSHLALEQPVLAEHAAGEGLRFFPDAPALKRIRAEALLQQNRLDQALSIYEQLYHNDNGHSKPDHQEIAQRIGLIHQVKGNSAFQQKELEKAEKSFEKVREFMPDSLYSYHNLALVYLQQEKWKEALKVTARGLIRFPGNSDLLRMRANALYRTENFEGVVDQYREIYKQQPGDLDTALQYARLLMASGDSEEAYVIYDRLLEEQPKNREVFNSLAEVYEQRNDTVALRSLLRKMQERFPNDTTIPVRIARTYEIEEKWGQARQVYETLKQKHKDPSLNLAIAETWIQQDSLQAALEVYSAATEEYPKHVELLRRRGETEEKLTLFQAARNTYEKLLSLEKNSDHHTRLGRVLEVLEQRDSALWNYKKAIDGGTDEPYPYYRSAWILIEGGSLEQAFERTETALKFALAQVAKQQQMLTATLQQQGNLFNMRETDMKGKNQEEYNRMAEEIFYLLTDRFPAEKVLPVLRKLERDYPSSGRMLYLLSTYYKNSGNKDKQVVLLQRSVNLNPELTEAHLELGRYFEELGQNVQAIQAYERALSTDPALPDPHAALIRLYRNIGKLDSLIARWNARYRAQPDSEVLRTHLIEALHKAGRYEEARNIVGSE